jgi:uncharacterized membrane protein YtjA (UPF0391 family)
MFESHKVLANGERSAHMLMCKRRIAPERETFTMLYYALVFFIVALVAGVLGFGGVAIAAAGIAKILFFVFLVLFLVSLIGHSVRRV